jgi:hypothetical protein
MPVRRVVNHAEYYSLFNSPSGGIARDMNRRGIRVQSAAKNNLSGTTGSGPKRIDTGHLRSSLTHELFFLGGNIGTRVGTNVHYSMYVHEGTGIYGPKHMPIRPKTKNILAWKSAVYGAKKGKYAGWAFATSVKGMVPNRYLTNALTRTRSGSVPG